MAEIIPALLSFCANNTAVSAAFGTRIWQDKIPDKPGGGAQPFPHARMSDITTSNKYSHQGKAGRSVLIQVDVYDDDPAGADTNAELIRALFDGYRGMIGSINAGMVKARRVSGTWMEEKRNHWRILEIEVYTND